MNSSLQKALVASLLVVGGSMSAMGQIFTQGSFTPDQKGVCVDPNLTGSPYSIGFISYYLENNLWSAGLGITGTVAWKFCVPGGPSGSVPVAGRFQFGPGPEGSVQDNLRLSSGEFDVSPDDYTEIQYGSNHPAFFQGGMATSGSGWSFARIQQLSGTAQTSWLFGGNSFSESFVGASNRYMFAQTTNANVTARLVIDVLGDTARYSWALTNNTAAQIGLGLWLGQWIQLRGSFFNSAVPQVDNFGDDLGYFNTSGVFQPYIFVPGIKPLEVDQRFVSATSPSTFPAFIDFTGGDPTGSNAGIQSPQTGGGMQIVNAPYSNVEDANGQSDQTLVDEVDIGAVEFLMAGNGLVTNPTFGDITFPDADFGDDACFVQKWQPNIQVPVGTTRNITSYYRSVWGDANYADGYTAVVDTPKVLSTSATTGTLDPNPFTIRVNVDNTGGFGQVYKSVDMTNCQVTLKLPQGMHAVGNAAQTTLTQFTGKVPARSMAFTDFKVQADATIFGPQNYSVTLLPSPGATKTISGSINVAASPMLQILAGANLVTSPWSYSDPTWESVLAPLVPVQDFQAYTWDPVTQGYILQTGPQRGVGSWIVSNTTHGFFELNGNPKQPTDQFPPSTGAPNITLHAGWNLIGNPYNYSFPLGQLVGVTSGTSTALTYQQLVTQNIIDGSFAYYDPQNQSYNFLQASTDELLPNYGYWVFASTPITLNFPPIFDLFVRAPQPDAFKQYANHWKLQLSATQTPATGTIGVGGGVRAVPSTDSNNFVGVDTISTEVLHMSSRKPPMSYDPHNTAIRAFASSSNVIPGSDQGQGSNATANTEYAQLMHQSPGKQVFNYSVYSHGAGSTTVTWPNLTTLPKNLSVSLEDMQTHKVINARSTAGYGYLAPANSIKNFQVTITPEGTVRQAISNVSNTIKAVGGIKQMTLNYTTETGGLSTIYVYQGGTKIGTIVQNQAINAGKQSIVWGMRLSSGQLIGAGEYTLLFQAVGDGGDTATKLLVLNL